MPLWRRRIQSNALCTRKQCVRVQALFTDLQHGSLVYSSKGRAQSLELGYRPMGCCISTAGIHSSDPAADSVPTTLSVTVSPQPVAEESSATLSRPRQCSRPSPAAHDLTHDLTPERQMTSHHWHSRSIRGAMSSPPQSPHWVNCSVTDPGENDGWRGYGSPMTTL
jgi:hypothetical protein